MSYHSKYDAFWLKNIDKIREIIKKAYFSGSASIDISEIVKYGRRKRDSWYGKIVICRVEIVKNSIMVHLRSLDRIILGNNLLNKYDSCFSFTVTKDLILLVKKIDNTNILDSTSTKTISESHTLEIQNINKPSLSSHNLFRNKPIGPKCECDQILKGFRWHELSTLKSSQLPREPGVYIIRVIEKGEDLINAKLKLKEIVLQSGWDELIRYVTNRLTRLFRIRNCPLIYIGSTGNIRSRFKDLAGRRHTAFFPILALLLSGWKLDYGFRIVASKNAAEHLEEELKKKYQRIHGFLPAFVEV